MAETINLAEDPHRLLTASEVTALLNLKSDRTLRTWDSNGIGPRRIRVGGKFIRYRASDLVQWIDEQAAVTSASSA